MKSVVPLRHGMAKLLTFAESYVKTLTFTRDFLVVGVLVK